MPEKTIQEIEILLLPGVTIYDNHLNCVVNQPLVEYLKKNGILLEFLNGDGMLPELYSYVFSSSLILSQQPNVRDFRQLVNLLRDTKVYAELPALHYNLEFAISAFFAVNKNVVWKEFISPFDPNNWDDIILIGNLIPLCHIGVEDFSTWLCQVVEAKENDGALNIVGNVVNEWVRQHRNPSSIEQKLDFFATDMTLNNFFAAFIDGINYHFPKPLVDYISFFQPFITAKNAYRILYGLGIITLSGDREVLYGKLEECFDCKVISISEYINLCTQFTYYQESVYKRVSDNFSDNSEFVNVLARYLYNVPASIDQVWFENTIIKLCVQNGVENSDVLQGLVNKILPTRIALVYEIIERQFKMYHGQFLFESTLVELSNKHQNTFQAKIIEWLNSDEESYHLAIRRFTMILGLNEKLFQIPTDIYDQLSNSEKLFVACKVVGYVYSVDVLQPLIISLIKSIKENNTILIDRLDFLLREYIVYNYRSTLDILRTEIKSRSVNAIAKQIFRKSISTFDEYFEQLRAIHAKELVPNVKFVQTRNFYSSKQFEELSKDKSKGNLQKLFKGISVNSNKWAIRRPGELKHTPQLLSQVSVSGEFPSGEKLNPIYQEFMRKTYQRLRKDEINID